MGTLTDTPLVADALARFGHLREARNRDLWIAAECFDFAVECLRHVPPHASEASLHVSPTSAHGIQLDIDLRHKGIEIHRQPGDSDCEILFVMRGPDGELHMVETALPASDFAGIAKAIGWLFEPAMEFPAA